MFKKHNMVIILINLLLMNIFQSILITHQGKNHKERKLRRNKKNKALFFNSFTYNFSSDFNFKEEKIPEVKNEKFIRAYHSSNRNYFQFQLKRDPKKNNLIVFDNYIKNWFELDSDNETITVEEMELDHKDIGNRFKVEYFNKLKNQNKIYYFDVDFMDRKLNYFKYKKNKVFVRGSNSDSNFNKNYDYTLEKECLAIQRTYFNPDEIKCEPLINKYNYVVFHVFNVTMVYKRGATTKTVKKIVTVITSKSDEKADKLFPKKNIIQKTKIKSILALIKFRIDNMKTTIKDRVFNKYLNNRNLLKRILEIDLKVKSIKADIKNIMVNTELDYQENVKSNIFQANKDQTTKDVKFNKTYDIMNAKVDELNAFEIRSTLKKNIHELDFKTKYKSHFKKALHFSKEIRMMRLLDDYDYLRYVKDNKIDEYYRLDDKK